MLLFKKNHRLIAITQMILLSTQKSYRPIRIDLIYTLQINHWNTK